MDTSAIYQVEDLLAALLWAVIVLVVSYFIVQWNKEAKPHYKWFIPVVMFKMLMGLFFGYTYVKILGYGGDTVAYWDGALKLNALFFHDPSAYFNEMWITPSRETLFTNFNHHTGFPPSWIYYEPESFFVSKIVSVFTFFTFNSFNALTIVFSFLSSLACFKLFELIRNMHLAKDYQLAIAVLFFPTVAFWCSGISKDTVILIVLYLLVVCIFKLLAQQTKNRIKHGFIILFLVFLAAKIRPFMLVAIFLPFLLAYGFSLLNKIQSDVLAFLSKTSLVVGVIGVMLFTLFTSALPFGFGESYLEEVAIIQQDFAANVTYGGPRYDLNIQDYTPLGMLRAGPLAILTALYRPFLWEAGGQGAMLLLSGLESLFLIGLTLFFFFSGSLKKKFSQIVSHRFLLFALLFALIFGFFVGYTAGLFNVLVRFKAPLMVFFILVLLVDGKSENKLKTADGAVD